MREWDASFHVASCLDRRPVVRGSKTAKCRKEPPQQPAVVGFRGLRILRSAEAAESREGLRGAFGQSSASAPSSLFGPMPTIPLRPISSAGAVHSGSANMLPLAPFASVEGLRPATVAPHAEAELMARLGRIKSELQAARRQHDAAVDDAEQAAASLAAAEAAHRERKACLGAMRAEVRAQGAAAAQMRIDTAAAVERAQQAQAARAEAEGAVVAAAATPAAAATNGGGAQAQPAASADPGVAAAEGGGRDGASNSGCGLHEEWDGSEDAVALLPGQPPMDAERLLIEAKGGGSFALLCGGLGLGLASPEEPMRVPLGVLMQRAEALAEACGAMREEHEQLEASSRVMEARLIFAELDPPDGLLREHHLRACPPLAARVPPLVWRRAIEGTKRDSGASARTPSQRGGNRPGGGGGGGQQRGGGATMDEASFVAFLEWFRQPTAPDALEGWMRILDMDGDGVLSEADLRNAAKANAAIAGGGATGAELRAEIDARIAQLHALVQSGGGSDFSPDSLLATPFDQFVRILFGLPLEEAEPEPEAEPGAGEPVE